LVAFTISLPDLPADLNSGFINPFFNRTELALNLLEGCSCIRESRSQVVDIGMEVGDIAALPSLLPLEQINLLWIDTGGQPSRRHHE
jgi:hypothetical protein